jgi:8-oxo-dGTP pyrophosphatase MutT (NUDIX family)
MEPSLLLDALKPHLTDEPPSVEKDRVLSAVMVIIHFRSGEPHVVLTKRSASLKTHAGQISFPGGIFAESDKELLHTALRETEEEIGVSISESDVLGHLRGVVTLTSSFAIVPYVALVEYVGTFRPNAGEIDAILDPPLLGLLGTIRPDTEHASLNELHRFEYDGNVVWGATARILKQIHDILCARGMI